MNENENEDEDDDDIMKKLIHSNDYDEETMNQNKKNKIIKKWNDHLDKIIDKSKSFEDQIKSIRKIENLYDDYYYLNNFGDKELKFKIFKLRLAHLSNDIDENFFEKIFGLTLIKLADKLINTRNKKENQIIVKNIKKNKTKIFEKYYFYDWVIESSNQGINLKDAIDIILNFNENKNEDEYENEDEDDFYEDEYENEDDDETKDQNEIKKLNDCFDEIIDKLKSFEDQIKSLKKEKI